MDAQAAHATNGALSDPAKILTRRGDVSHVAASPRLPCQA